MKLEGMDEFAASVGKAAKALERFGQRTQSAGRAITRIGLNLMAAGLLFGGLLLLVFWVF